jgi:hypothetical protein
MDPVVAGTAGRVAPEGADVLEPPGVEPAEGLRHGVVVLEAGRVPIVGVADDDGILPAAGAAAEVALARKAPALRGGRTDHQRAAAAETAQGGQGRRQTPHGSGTKGDPGRVSTKTRCHCSSISKLHSREW